MARPVTMSDVKSIANSIYICFSTFLLACVGFKLQTANSNFEDYIVVVLIFLVAIFCHVVALKAAKTSWPTTIISHVSGVIACEALLWVLATQLLYCIIVNVLMALIVVPIYYKDIRELVIKPEVSEAEKELEENEGTGAHVIEIKGNDAKV